MKAVRIITSIVISALVVVTGMTFFTYVSTPTDENIFRDIPSTLIVSRTFPAKMIGSKPFVGTQVKGPLVSDSILNGDMIYAINDGNVFTIKDAEYLIRNFPEAAEINFTILRPSLNSLISFAVPAQNVPLDFLVRVKNFAYVSDVTPNGASDRAGMKVGDLILRINEKSFDNAIGADRILRTGQIGKSIRYDILRSNRYVNLDVTLAQFGIPFGQLLFTLSGLVVFFIGGFLLLSRPQIVAARLLGLGFVCIGFFMSVLLVRRDFDITMYIMVRNIIMSAMVYIGPAFLFHAFLHFPKEQTRILEKKWIVRGYYFVSAAAGALTLLLDTNIYILLPVTYGIGVILLNRKQFTQEYKELAKSLKYVSLVSSAIIAVLVFLQYNRQDALPVGFVGVVLTAVPLTVLYIIGRYHLLDINLRIRRNTQYTAITILWTVGIIFALIYGLILLMQMEYPTVDIVFTGASIELGDSLTTEGRGIPVQNVLLLLFGGATLYASLKVRTFGQHVIDRKYFRTQYDYQQISKELNEILSTTLTMHQLAKNFVQRLGELMNVKKVGVLFFRDQECCACEEAYGFESSQWKSFCIASEELLIESINRFQNEFRIDYLPESVKKEFSQEGFQYLIPIRSKEKLLGVLIIGEKKAETTFRQEDLNFLRSVAAQASVAIENAFLYEELAENERMKHELAIARKIQLDSLPVSIPHIEGLDISGRSLPAMEVGGDFYDYLSNSPQRITVIVGDVSGKGTSAALYMSKVQGILRSLHGFQLQPGDLLQRANTLLCRDLEKRSFVTVIAAEFSVESSSLIVSRAGHLPLWHYHHASGSVRRISSRGIGLGLTDEEIFPSELEQRHVEYASGDVFVFATDGITEARDVAQNEFGEDAVSSLLLEYHSLSAQAIREEIFGETKRFIGAAQQHDDQTLVVVKAI